MSAPSEDKIIEAEVVENESPQPQTEPIGNPRPADAELLPAVSRESRQTRIWELRMRGLTVSAIAGACGVSETTVYSDLKAIAVRYRDSIIKTTAIDIVAANLQWLDEMENVALMEVHLSKPTMQTELDENGGVKKYEVADPHKSRFFQAALQAREMKLKLLTSTGIIPKQRAELFHELDEFSGENKEQQLEARTEEEIQEDIKRLLEHGRTLK